MALTSELVHALLAGLFLFAAYYDYYVVRLPDVFRERTEQSWGRSKFLSYWNLYFQLVFFALAFLDDVLRRLGLCRPQGAKLSLRKILDSAFAAVGFPVALVVSTCFGLIFTINRELAYPLMFDTFIPRWLTYIVQFGALPAVLVEMLVVDRRYDPRDRRCNQLVLALFLVLNMLWVVYVGHTCQFFALQALEPLSVAQQVGAALGCAALGQGPYYLGEMLHHAVWGQDAKADKKRR